jgi:hypothetical protein
MDLESDWLPRNWTLRLIVENGSGKIIPLEQQQDAWLANPHALLGWKMNPSTEFINAFNEG